MVTANRSEPVGRATITMAGTIPETSALASQR